ncbi:MAG: hypothetical protein ACU0B9_07355 [Limimaricola soesokkakensis]|uniref:hypothetical protein n=1 Tax=Limimaricola soesokkakensis TaxID=1343159 RepID=UPI004058733B
MTNLAILAPVRVVSFSYHRRPVAPPVPVPVPVPEAGAAWGSPAAFDYSLQPSGVSAEISDGSEGDEEKGLKVSWPSGNVRISGVEEFREATLETIPLGGDAAEVEGIRSVTFYTGTREIRHEERTVQGAYTSIEPTIEHRKEYLRIGFPFAAALERGDPPPPDTPPLPDLDAHHGV